MVTTPLSPCKYTTAFSLLFPNAQGNLLFLHQSRIPLGNGRAHHLMHVNANKTPILTSNGFKPIKRQMQCSNDKNWQV